MVTDRLGTGWCRCLGTNSCNGPLTCSTVVQEAPDRRFTVHTFGRATWPECPQWVESCRNQQVRQRPEADLISGIDPFRTLPGGITGPTIRVDPTGTHFVLDRIGYNLLVWKRVAASFLPVSPSVSSWRVARLDHRPPWPMRRASHRPLRPKSKSQSIRADLYQCDGCEAALERDPASLGAEAGLRTPTNQANR